VSTSYQRDRGNTLLGGRPGLSGDPELQLRVSTGLAPVSPLSTPIRGNGTQKAYSIVFLLYGIPILASSQINYIDDFVRTHLV
jgi:hypothetical protein